MSSPRRHRYLGDGGDSEREVDPDAGHGGTEIVGCEFKWGISPGNLNNSATCDQALPINGNAERHRVRQRPDRRQPPTSFRQQRKTPTTASCRKARLRPFSRPARLRSPMPRYRMSTATGPHSRGRSILRADIPPTRSNTERPKLWPQRSRPGRSIPNSLGKQSFSQLITGLQAGTVYHFRISATNPNDTTLGPDHTFTTFPSPRSKDPCPNAHVRQQVSAALLPDCRAYELVSAADTGGYDVESDLVAGQHRSGAIPTPGQGPLRHPQRRDPRPWNPTNRGVDPYVATRGTDGWTTDYVGHPGRQSVCGVAVRLDPGEASRPRPLRLRRPGNLLPLLRRRLDRYPGARGQTAAWSRGWPAPTNPAPRRARRPGPQAVLGRRHPPDLRLDLAVRRRR